MNNFKILHKPVKELALPHILSIILSYFTDYSIYFFLLLSNGHL